MSTLLVDTSVVVKWCHEQGEPEVEAARALLGAHARGTVTARVLDLAYYELGNVLTTLRWSAGAVADQLADLRLMCGVPLGCDLAWLPDAAALAHRHRLTFYDAAWVASAQALDVPLVSSDRRILRAGLGVSPTVQAERLGLR